MKNKFFKQRSFYAVFLSVVLSVVLVAGAAGAATTISTNITTGGTLTVTGVTSLNGNVNIGDATSGNDDLVYLYGTTTVIGAQAFVLGSSTEDLTGQKEGSLYYDTENDRIRLFKGDGSWTTLASSTDASGGLTISGSTVRFNTIADGAMVLGTTTGFATDATTFGSILTLQATTTASVPLTIFGPEDGAGTTNLFEVLSHTAAELFVIDEIGNASSTHSLSIGLSPAVADEGSLFVSGMATTTGATGNIATQGTLTVTGATVLNGAVTLGDAIGDLITLTGNASTSKAFTIGVSSAVAEEGSLFVSGMATTTGATGDFATAGSISVGTTTVPVAEATIDAFSAGTTTLRLKSSVGGATTGAGCIEIMGTDGATYYLVASSSGFAVFQNGSCEAGQGDGSD
ncbi:MAG: hypothetical protein HYS73_00040 [Parcubacteria group bacterium]|nr:hypothetical protein [Parcubacteria group bacterium]MBI2049238.1 hypothetical protein [Parcubacteria group bacterium]